MTRFSTRLHTSTATFISGRLRPIRTWASCSLAKTSACIALYYRIRLMQQLRLTCRLVAAHYRVTS